MTKCIWVKIRREYLFSEKCNMVIYWQKAFNEDFTKSQLVIHNTIYGQYIAMLPSRKHNPMTKIGKNILLGKYFEMEYRKWRRNMVNLEIIEKSYNLTDVNTVISSYF